MNEWIEHKLIYKINRTTANEWRTIVEKPLLWSGNRLNSTLNSKPSTFDLFTIVRSNALFPLAVIVIGRRATLLSTVGFQLIKCNSKSIFNHINSSWEFPLSVLDNTWIIEKMNIGRKRIGRDPPMRFNPKHFSQKSNLWSETSAPTIALAPHQPVS